MSHADTVRLHYRAVNQLAKFKTIESPASKAVFIIPAADVKEQWDLMYYFEVLNTTSVQNKLDSDLHRDITTR